MLFTIHNLPLSANLTRIKQLIKYKCNISDVIVDNLVKLKHKGQNTKQVTIGLADSSDAALFFKNINGLLIDGHQLYVEDVRPKNQSEYLYCPSPPQISNNSLPQHSVDMGMSMQGPPVPIPPVPMPVQVPMAYSNMPFYMTPLQPNSNQRNYVGNNTPPPLDNLAGQVPFYQQESKFIQNRPNQNQWRSQAISYPIPGFTQKTQEPMQGQVDMKRNSPRKPESDWRDRYDGPLQNINNIWNSSENVDVSMNKIPSRNERDLRQRSPRDRSHRDRSPRDRPPGDHFRDRPPREHSPRDRTLRRRSPGERSRDRDHRRKNDPQSKNRYSKVERSPPRSRRNERDVRDRDRRLGNRRDERSQRSERSQRPDRSQGPERHPRSERPERPQRPEIFEDCENDYHNRGFDRRRAPRDVDQRINQKREFSPNIFEHFQQNPALYSEESANDIHRDYDYPQPPCDIDQHINQNINHQQSELQHSEVFQQNSVVYSSSSNNCTFVPPNVNNFTENSVFQLDNIASLYDPEPREPPFKKMRVSGVEPPRFNKQLNKFNQSVQDFSKFQPKFQDDAYPSQYQDKSLSVKLLKHNKWITNAARILSKQIIANANGGVVPDNPECLTNLRKCITSRIDVILGDRILNTMRDITDAYRAKFGEDDDLGFFNAVMDKIERDSKESLKSEGDEAEERSPDVQPGPSNAHSFMPNRNGGKFRLRAAKQNANFNIAAAYKNYANNGANNEEAAYHLQNPRLNISKPSDLTKRLPSFPQGDKQIYKDQKKLQKLELHEEIYTLDPIMKKALDDEMALLCKMYTSVCEEPTPDDEQQDFLRVKIKNLGVTEFKKIVQLHLTKRLLNIPNNLVIRIFANPKPPKRDVIDDFLKNYDVASLRKSDKKYQTFFLLTCASYESYDEILKLRGHKVSDTCTLQFRPMHLTGPKNSGNPAKLNRGKSNIPPENIIPDDEVEELLEESNMDIKNYELNIDNVGDDDQGNYDGEVNIDEEGNEDQENDENKLIIDEHASDNQESDKNELNIHKDGDDSVNLNKNILDNNCNIGNDFTNDHINYEEFANWNNRRLDDSDVVLLETKYDVVVVDDNDKTLTIVDEENNDNDSAALSNDDKEEVNANSKNDEGLDQNTNIVDEGMIEGVDVNEDDLEDF